MTGEKAGNLGEAAVTAEGDSEKLAAATSARIAPPLLRRLGRVIWAAIGWVLIALSAVLIGAALWIEQTFGLISVDQLLMHLPGAGAAEVVGVAEDYVSSFVVDVLIVPLGVVALLAVAVYFGKRTRARKRENHGVKYPSQRRPPGTRSRPWARPLFVVVACTVGVSMFAQTVGLPQYLGSIFSPWTMADYYVAPESNPAELTASAAHGAPMNLVTIYIESGEEALGDDELFEINMLEPLERATSDWSRFNSLDVYEGGGWTMAGLVGTECGVPLRGAGTGQNDIESNNIGDGSAAYLPGATCIGDVLSDAGYYSVFMGGADAAFASKGSFLTSHGYDEVMDLATWSGEDGAELGPWGLSDARLMDHAKEQVTKLHDSGQPFQLSILTLDAHEPVHLYENCPLITKDELVSAIYCSMSSVADFVDYMNENGYLENTVVFITGDHPKMVGEGASFRSELHDLLERPLFNRLWVPGGVTIEREHIDQLSVYATLLDTLNLGREDGRAGIGVSAQIAGPENPATGEGGRSVLDLSKDEYKALIQSRSAELYQQLWNTPRSRPESVRMKDQ